MKKGIERLKTSIYAVSALFIILVVAAIATVSQVPQDENIAGEAARPTRPPAATYECSDSDNGQNMNLAGKVEISNSKRQTVSSASDTCLNSKQLTEYYCQTAKSGSISSVTLNCATGHQCSNGACVKVDLPPTGAISVDPSFPQVGADGYIWVSFTAAGNDDNDVQSLSITSLRDPPGFDPTTKPRTYTTNCDGIQTSCAMPYVWRFANSSLATGTGDYTFQVDVTDNAGKRSEPVTATVKI